MKIIKNLTCLLWIWMSVCVDVCSVFAVKASPCLSTLPSQSVVSNHTEAHSKLKLSNVTDREAGKYWCRASNFVGKSENAFWLKVHDPGKSWATAAIHHLWPSAVSSFSFLVVGLIGSLWLPNRTNTHKTNLCWESSDSVSDLRSSILTPAAFLSSCTDQ